MHTSEILRASRTNFLPSPLNPRKSFRDDKLNELGLNIRGEAGVINPLTVRIRPDGKLEIICGECRWRSSEARPHPITGETMPALDELPYIARDLTDAQALELMLSENMQRNDLSEIEEAEGFAMALKQTDAEGKPIHTRASLAEKIGVSESLIKDRLSLTRLPKEGREALLNGTHSFRVMRACCRAPLSLVPKLVDVVLNPRKYPLDRWPAKLDDPITAEEVAAQIDDMSAPLMEAPFALDDASLVPLKTNPGTSEPLEGGACTECPFNSANQTSDGGPKYGTTGSTVSRCLNKACYTKKVNVHVSAALVRLKEEGAHLAKDSEAEAILRGGPNRSANPDYVELDEKLAPTERAPGMTEKQAPKWGELVKDKDGKTVAPVIAVVDSAGNVRKFTERKVATAAAEKLGKAAALSLEAGRGTSLQQEDIAKQEKQRKQEDAVRQKLRLAISRKTMAGLVTQIEEKGVPADAWPSMLEVAICHAGSLGVNYVCNRRGIEKGAKPDEALETFGAGLRGSPLMGLVVELLFAESFAYASGPNAGGSVMPNAALPVFEHYEVDVKQAEADAKAECAPKKEAPKAKRKATEAALFEVLADYGLAADGKISKTGWESIATAAKVAGVPGFDEAKTIEELDGLLVVVKARLASLAGAGTREPSAPAAENAEPEGVGDWLAWSRLTEPQVMAAKLAHETLSKRALEEMEFRFMENGDIYESRSAWRKFDELAEEDQRRAFVHYAGVPQEALRAYEYKVDGTKIVGRDPKAKPAKKGTAAGTAKGGVTTKAAKSAKAEKSAAAPKPAKVVTGEQFAKIAKRKMSRKPGAKKAPVAKKATGKSAKKGARK